MTDLYLEGGRTAPSSYVYYPKTPCGLGLRRRVQQYDQTLVWKESNPIQYTITQKMADWGRFDLGVILPLSFAPLTVLFGKLRSSYSQISFK